MKKQLKPYFIFSTVWHKKGEPYNVTSYNFYVVDYSEENVKKVVSAELRGYMHWKHSITIEEIKLDRKQMRSLTSRPFDSVIIAEAVEKCLKLEKGKHAKLKSRCERARLSCCFVKLDKLLSGFPIDMYDLLAKNLSPNSMMAIDDGVLYIYHGPKSEETFRETDLDMQKERLKNKMKAILEDAVEKINEMED